MADETEFMQLAIQQAKLSRGKPTDPRVGAILVSRGRKVIAKAHRGQKASGDHAEFTLIQKIVRSKDVFKGTTLYTTLEPCTTRSHDKLPCAQWIIRKEIPRVVIGILDPNPTICGKGYWELRRAGIAVELFAPPFAAQVEALNEAFISDQNASAIAAPGFANEIAKRKSQHFARYPALGWGDTISILDCPDLRSGWPPSMVRLNYSPHRKFVLPKKYRRKYLEFFKEKYDEYGFAHDGVKFMLRQNPISFSDAPSVMLDVLQTKYSVFRYYQERVISSQSSKNAMIDEFISGSLKAQFPQSLCMHIVVVTSDHKILRTKRSMKVAYCPGTWSVSIEEQMHKNDLTGASKNSAIRLWAARALFEELGLDKSAYHEDNLRVLSLFLETEPLNVSLCLTAEVRQTAKALDRIIRGQTRTDYEFTEWDFLELERGALLGELFLPTQNYHPTSGYRMLYTYLKNFGSHVDSGLLRSLTSA